MHRDGRTEQATKLDRAWLNPASGVHVWVDLAAPSIPEALILSNINNRLNEVMKVLTVVATILLPLTLLTSIYGMNVPLPQFPGGEHAQFWWLFGIMAVTVVAMLAMFRSRRWI